MEMLRGQLGVLLQQFSTQKDLLANLEASGASTADSLRTMFAEKAEVLQKSTRPI